MRPDVDHCLTEANFNEWMTMLADTDQLSAHAKKAFLKDLRATRQVMITDMRDFFKDAVDSGELEDTDYPYSLSSKALPFAILDSFETVKEATDFCDSVGVTYSLYVYEQVSQAVH